MTAPEQAGTVSGAGKHRTQMRTRWQRMVGVFRRAFGHAGPDRDVLLLLVKSVVAATAAWTIANNLLGAPSATFAPFTALLMVQATISQSMDQSARYGGAMVFGVLLTGVLTPVMGAATVTFAVLLLVALVVGRWRKLGQQGPQVGVAALFAYASFTQSGASSSSFLQLGSIVGLVILGCVLGVVTNLLIAPPMRYRSAQYGVSVLAHSLCDLLTDVSEGLAKGVPDQDQAEAWLHRANQFPEAIAQASSAVDRAVEVRRFNPRRLLLRRSVSFEGHRTIINMLSRATEQLRSAARGLTYANSANTARQREHEQFLDVYSTLLANTAEAARATGQIHRVEDTDEAEHLNNATDQASQVYNELAEHVRDKELDGPGQWAVYGGLQTDARRLVEEFIEAHRQLSQLLGFRIEDPPHQSAQAGAAQTTEQG